MGAGPFFRGAGKISGKSCCSDGRPFGFGVQELGDPQTRSVGSHWGEESRFGAREEGDSTRSSVGVCVCARREEVIGEGSPPGTPKGLVGVGGGGPGLDGAAHMAAGRAKGEIENKPPLESGGSRAFGGWEIRGWQ